MEAREIGFSGPRQDPRSKVARSVVHLLDRRQPPEEVILVGTALVVGLGTGVSAVVFIWLLRFLQRLFAVAGDWLQTTVGPVGLIGLPVLGALIAGPLITFFAREAKGHGVPEVMQAIALRGGRIRPVVVVVKALASAACISSGGSAGREGPIVQIGSALGSTVGQLFHLSDDRIRNLVACGAASGISAVFNAPIAGVIFALEVILGEFTTRYFGTVVIAAVASGIVGRALLGDQPAFHVPAYTMVSPWEIVLYALLGVLTAVGAILFVRLLYWFEDRFDGWRLPEFLKPAVGGLLTGVVGLWFPQVLGSGLEFIGESISSGELAVGLLLALAGTKVLATSFTLGSGNSGGVFAPALFIGAMVGGAFGQGAHSLLPGLTAPAGAYALVGMAALFAAAAHAPITAVLIVFEMSGDYRLILPLMFATVISTLLSEHWHPESIYTLKLSRRGVRLERGHDIDVMQGVLVGEAMSPDPDTVAVDLSLEELDHLFVATHHHGFPVLDTHGDLFGVVTIQDLERARERGGIEGRCVGDIATTPVLTAFPDEPVWVALKRLGTRDVGRLPVVSRNDPKKLVGLVRRYDIIRAYQRAILRRMDVQQRRERLRLGRLVGAEFVELEVTPECSLVGKYLRDLDLPRECVIVSVRRGRQLILPHGDTFFEVDDRVTALVGQDCKALVCGLFLQQAKNRGESTTRP
ncbi:MAG: chloride channel protein [Chloroflexota bacterium]